MVGIGSLINTRSNLIALGYPSLINSYREVITAYGSEPNVYMFHKIDKISFVKEELVVEKKRIIFRVKNHTQNYHLTFDLTKTFQGMFAKKVYFNGKYELLSSSKRIKIFLTNDTWITIDALDLVTNYQYFQFVQEKETYFDRERVFLDTIYIGMAYGKDGNRNAFDRISNHSKLQEILSESHDEQWDKDVIISLWEVHSNIIMGMIGNSDSSEKDIDYINKILNGPIDYKQLVNLTEAGMIYHLQPVYNTALKKNFPNDKSKSYSEIYFREFDGISIEFGLEDHFVTVGAEDIAITEQNPFIEIEWLDINNKEFFKKMVNGEVY